MGRVQVKKETVFINDIPVDKAMLTGTPGLGETSPLELKNCPNLNSFLWQAEGDCCAIQNQINLQENCIVALI